MTLASLSGRFAAAAASTLMLAGCVTPDFGYPNPLLGSGDPRAEIRVDPVDLWMTSTFIQVAYKHHTVAMALKNDIAARSAFNYEADDAVNQAYQILSEEGNCAVEDALFPQCFVSGYSFRYSSPLFGEMMQVSFSDITDTCISYSITFETSAIFANNYDLGPLVNRQRCETETSSFIGDYDVKELPRPFRLDLNPHRL